MLKIFKNLFSQKIFLKKQIIFGVVLCIIFFFTTPSFVSALSWSDIPLKIGEVLVGLILQLFLLFANAFLSIGALLLSWIIGNPFSISYTNPAENEMIRIGWTLLRDLCNMFFILGMVYIGLTTALRLSSGSKMFFDLIFTALLINFTPLICGLFVDASNIVMNFFLSGLIGFEGIVNVFTNQGTLLLKVLMGWPPDPTLAPRLLSLIMFGYITGFIFFVYCFTFLMRYFALWIITILSPLAFLARIFPETKKYYDMWWRNLFQWSFLGATGAFFIYLSQHIILEAGKKPFMGSVALHEASEVINALLPYWGATIFLYFGYGVAFYTSAMGAKQVIGFGTKIAGQVRSYFEKAPLAITQAAGTAVVGGVSGAAAGLKAAKAAGATKGGKVLGGLKGFGKGAFTKEGRIEGMEKIGGFLESAHLVRPGWFERTQIKHYKTAEAEERLKGLSDDRLRRVAERVAFGDTEEGERAVAVKILGQRGKFVFKKPDGSIDTNKEKDLIERANKIGVDLSDLAKSRPDLTPEIKADKFKKELKKLEKTGITITAQVELDVKQNMIINQIEGMKPQVFRDKIQIEALKSPRVLPALDEQKIRDLGIRGTLEQRRTLAETSISPELTNYENEIRNRVTQLRGAGRNDEADKLEGVVDRMRDNYMAIAYDANFVVI